MSLSQLARSIAESPTLKLNEEARMLREKGEPVIHLGIGEPKNKAPINGDPVSGAAKLTSGDVKYTPTDGMPSLKKAIIRYTEENYDKRRGAENVIVSVGRQAVRSSTSSSRLLQPAGRGGGAGALLGELPRDDPDVLRRAGDRDARGRRASTRASRRSSGR